MATPRKLWVQVKSNVTGAVGDLPVKVPIEDCEDIDDFTEVVKEKLTRNVPDFFYIDGLTKASQFP